MNSNRTIEAERRAQGDGAGVTGARVARSGAGVWRGCGARPSAVWCAGRVGGGRAAAYLHLVGVQDDGDAK
eukprot:3491786-Prymnesium_polylepis.1